MGLLEVIQKISNVAHSHKFPNLRMSIKSDLWYTERMYSVRIHNGLHKNVNVGGWFTATSAGLKADLRVIIFQVFLYTSSYSMISRIKLH
jgi:hypothetical protein